MAKRTLNALAKIIARRVDKDDADTVFVAFAEECLVLALQEIDAEVPWARWLMDEASLNPTVSGTQYIVMPADMDIDALTSITDRSNSNRKVRRITPEEADEIDPGRDDTGDEILWWYQRVETTSPTYEDRIYFLNRPDSADTLSAIFGTLVPVPASGSASVLPEKYEPFWIEGGIKNLPPRVKVEPIHESRFQKGLAIIRRDANKTPGDSAGLASHRSRYGRGTFGPSFPANYDVTP